MSSLPSISKLQAALESAIRTFVQSFVASVAVINFTTESLDGVKIALVAGAASAGAAALAALARPFVPLSTDRAGVGVE